MFYGKTGLNGLILFLCKNKATPYYLGMGMKSGKSIFRQWELHQVLQGMTNGEDQISISRDLLMLCPRA